MTAASGVTKPATVAEALSAAAHELAGAGIDSPRLDARLLLAEAYRESEQTMTTVELLAHRERPIEPVVWQRFQALLGRRRRREPVSRILGRREFWSLPFMITADTLDPRPDSETLVEALLGEVQDKDRMLRILDLGAGTGCLLLALLSELPNATGLGLDISAAACDVARQNAQALDLDRRATFVLGNWGLEVEGRFNLIVTNPPYIPECDIDGLTPEVAVFDPRRALSGGSDGLASYRALIPGLRSLLTPDGSVALEIGFGQAEPVVGLLVDHGFSKTDIRRDLAGYPRCVLAWP